MSALRAPFSFPRPHAHRVLRQNADATMQPSPSPSPSALPQPSDEPVPQPTAEDMLEPNISPETLDANDPVKPDELPSSIDLDIVEIIIALVVILVCTLIAHFIIVRWRRRRRGSAQYLPTSVPPGTNSLYPDHSYPQQSAPSPPSLYRPANPNAI